MKGTLPAMCVTHWGFIASACPVCAQPGGVFDVPRAESTRRTLPVSTTAEARSRRLAADAKARGSR